MHADVESGTLNSIPKRAMIDNIILNWFPLTQERARLWGASRHVHIGEFLGPIKFVIF